MGYSFRDHIIRLLLLFSIAVPMTAIANSSLDQRVAQLERVVGAQGDVITQLQQQLSDQQRDIENLRGQVQQNQYELSQSKKDLTQQNALTGNSDASNTASNNDSVSAQLSGDEKKDYQYAVSLALEKRQFNDAITVFKNFIQHYPNSIYQPNANYWLGQLSYNKKDLETAAYYFAYVVKNYPESNKSPDSMLKVGLIMQAQNQLNKAKVVYQQVVKTYPNTEAAKEAEKRLAHLN